MRKYILIFSLFLTCHFLTNAQENFSIDNIKLDTSTIKKSGKKFVLSYTAIDSVGNSVTTVTDINDTDKWFEEKNDELEIITDQIRFIDTNIDQLHSYIDTQKKQKQALDFRYKRILKQIAQMQKKIATATIK